MRKKEERDAKAAEEAKKKEGEPAHLFASFSHMIAW